MSGNKFAALGSRKKLLPLKSAGFDLYECSSFEEASSIINKLNLEGYDLVVINEDILENREDSFLEIIRSLQSTVLVLPEYKIRRNFTKGIIDRITKEAVGF